MLAKMLVIYFILALETTALHYVGKYKYQDVASFISSENACSFYPWNLQFIIGKGLSKSGDFCFIYTSLVQDVLAEAQITKVQFQYFASDVNKSFEQSFTQCHSNEHLQSMELNIVCEGLIAELLLNEPCLEEQMCTGREDAQNCTSNPNQLKSFCRCNAKYDLSTKLYKKSEYQDVEEKKDCRCNKEQKNSCLFTAVGLVFCIATCSLFGFIVELKRRKTNSYRLDGPISSQMPTRNTTTYSFEDDSEDTNGDRIRIEAYSHNSLDVRAENNCEYSENVNISSESQSVRKQPNKVACSLCQIRQKQLQMYDDIYSVARPMSISSELEEIYDELYHEEGNDDTRNLYDNSVRQSPYRDQQVDYNDTYDHLHQERIILSENVYGLSNISLSALNQQDKSDIENKS